MTSWPVGLVGASGGKAGCRNDRWEGNRDAVSWDIADRGRVDDAGVIQTSLRLEQGLTRSRLGSRHGYPMVYTNGFCN